MEELTLPYRTDWREMYRLLEYCKGKGADRSVLDARFGGGESLRETLNALDQLGLIQRPESGDVRLTDLGDRLAYAANDTETRLVLIEAMLLYWPYQVPLERAVGERLAVLDAPGVERIWQVDMRLAQPRNRVEEARTFFFRLADDAGLGTYRRGVRGQTTRLELAPDALATIQRVLEYLKDRVDTRTMPEPQTTSDAPVAAQQAPPRTMQINAPVRSAHRAATSLSIQVDMSDWDLDKIEAFLALVGYLDKS